MTDTNQQPTFDRVEELVATITDIFQHTHNPNTDEWELSGDLDQYPAYNALTELATIAREAEKNAEGQEANAVFALSLKRDAEAEAEKWRKVAEWLAGAACSCLGTRDCDVFFDEENPDRERICDECRQSQLNRALAAYDAKEGAK